jgi:hypothetical protein
MALHSGHQAAAMNKAIPAGSLGLIVVLIA